MPARGQRRPPARGPRGAGAGRGEGIVRSAKRLWPVALEAWRRWDRLPPHQKERYKRMAGDYARRGRDMASSRSRRRRK